MARATKKTPGDSDEPDRSMLVPRIKTSAFNDAMKKMKIPADQLPFSEPLVADLVVAYAFDLPGMFQMASLDSILELGIQKEDIRSVAIENLRRSLPEIGATDHGEFQRIVTGENLEACTLLAVRFWDQVTEETESEVVVAVPSRDVVLYCSSESEEGSRRSAVLPRRSSKKSRRTP